MAKLINGNKISADIKNEIKKEVEELIKTKRVKARSCSNTCW